MIESAWSSSSEARTCKGDSGGLLIFNEMSLGYPLHTGVAFAGTPCTQSSGSKSHTGLSLYYTLWILNVMGSYKQQHGLGFACTAVDGELTGGVYMLHCDNDGTWG